MQINENAVFFSVKDYIIQSIGWAFLIFQLKTAEITSLTTVYKHSHKNIIDFFA